MRYLQFATIGYLSGSVLYAYWIPKIFCHEDVTKRAKDHNPGAANVFTICGVTSGVLVLCLELLKAMLPVYYGAKVLDITDLRFLLVMIAPVVGHAFPIFHRFKGGKCIAASFGVLLGLYPNLSLALWLALFYLIYSLIIVISPHLYRSIVTFFSFQVVILLSESELSIETACIIIGMLVIYKHVLEYNKEQLKIHIGVLHKDIFWEKNGHPIIVKSKEL